MKTSKALNSTEIPKSFKLFGATINITWDNKLMNEKGFYGQADYSSSTITLSNTHGLTELSKDKILDTYYHEKVHLILTTMNKDDLSQDESFVDIFAKLLRQSDVTSEY